MKILRVLFEIPAYFDFDYDEFGQPTSNQIIDFDDYVKIGDPNPDFTFQ